jgi:putative ABC transport system substrate-binding protein
MDRRGILGALACVLAALHFDARTQGRTVPRVVLLLPQSDAASRPLIESFRQGLREAGQVEGQSLILEVRHGSPERGAPDGLLRDTLREHPDVLVVGGLYAAKLARELTSTIPVVVATSSDLVDAGVVASFARPGGNITGVSDLVDEAAVKRLELIRAALPGAKRVALLVNPAFPATPKIERSVGEAARRLGLTIVPLRTGNRAELAAAIDSMALARPDALLVGGDPLFNDGSFIARANALRVPVVHYWQGTAEKGALISYEADVRDNYRRAAGYVDKILKGAKPSELPIHRPNRYTLKLNLTAARTAGVEVPEAFRLRADEVIP